MTFDPSKPMNSDPDHTRDFVEANSPTIEGAPNTPLPTPCQLASDSSCTTLTTYLELETIHAEVEKLRLRNRKTFLQRYKDERRIDEMLSHATFACLCEGRQFSSIEEIHQCYAEGTRRATHEAIASWCNGASSFVEDAPDTSVKFAGDASEDDDDDNEPDDDDDDDAPCDEGILKSVNYHPADGSVVIEWKSPVERYAQAKAALKVVYEACPKGEEIPVQIKDELAQLIAARALVDRRRFQRKIRSILKKHYKEQYKKYYLKDNVAVNYIVNIAILLSVQKTYILARKIAREISRYIKGEYIPALEQE